MTDSDRGSFDFPSHTITDPSNDVNMKGGVLFTSETINFPKKEENWEEVEKMELELKQKEQDLERRENECVEYLLLVEKHWVLVNQWIVFMDCIEKERMKKQSEIDKRQLEVKNLEGFLDRKEKEVDKEFQLKSFEISQMEGDIKELEELCEEEEKKEVLLYKQESFWKQQEEDMKQREEQIKREDPNIKKK